VPAVIFCCVFILFLARFLFQSSFFSKSRLWTWPLFSHFVTNLDYVEAVAKSEEEKAGQWESRQFF
jgi:hypothetical protein